MLKSSGMKNFLFVLILGAAVVGCKDRKTDKVAGPMEVNGPMKFKDSTAIRLIDSSYNFGKVAEGEKVGYSYRFVNLGPNKLIVSKATPSCGCTIAEIPKEPLAIGDTGFIKIEFDSKGRPGTAHKTIHVESNAYPSFPDLELTGEVTGAQQH